MIPQTLRAELIRCCRRLDGKGWVANHDGNVTVRLQSGSFAATPGARAKADLVEEDLIEVDAKGKKTAGQGSPFSELAVHLRVFAARTDVQAIVHAHPPSATAVGCANQEMVTWAIPEAVVSLGPGIPLAGLALPNSDPLWAELDPLIPHYDAVMIAGNGVFAWGKTLEQAYLRLELVEHLAKILLATLPLGGPKLLEADQIEALLKKRVEAGLALPPDPARPGWFGGRQHSK
jgi:L-fuculose-phosphate aldolase